MTGAAFIFLTEADQKKLVLHLKQSLYSFASLGKFKTTRYSTKPVQAWFLKSSEDKCRFFKDGKCSVYEARPTQCRTFPFWPENMTQDKWAKIGELCPGIGKGESQPLKSLLEQVEADRELCSHSK